MPSAVQGGADHVIRPVPDAGNRHEIMPVPASIRDRDGNACDGRNLLNPLVYPLTGICAGCGAPARIARFLVGEWAHERPERVRIRTGNGVTRGEEAD
jgi:hypothetical protein